MQRVVEIVTRAVYALSGAVGLLFVWFARHYEHSIKFHWAVVFYLALDAWVHWFNAFGVFEQEPSAVINAIPFVVYLVLGLLRKGGFAAHGEVPGRA
jgi:phosphoglycerol transferase MdoB-like AlkP superfamily enzyme